MSITFNAPEKDSFLYIFKKQSGEYLIAQLNTAYNMYYGSNISFIPRMQYMGRVGELEYKKLHRLMVINSKVFRKELLANPVLIEAMSLGKELQEVMPEEEEYLKLVADFDRVADVELYTELLKTAVMIPPDASFNIITPQGNRDQIVALMPRM